MVAVYAFTTTLSNVFFFFTFNWVIEESEGATGKWETAKMEWLLGDWSGGMVGG